MNNRLRLILAISITAIVLALVLAHIRQGPDPTPSPGPTATPTEPAALSGTSLPSADMFGNRLEGVSDPAGQPLPQDPTARLDPARPDYLTAPPAGIQWQRGWDGAALPVSRSDGPARIQNGIASGFADTPQGAGLAACDAVARATAAPEGVWQTVVRERYLGGGEALEARFTRSHRNNAAAGRYVTVPEGVRVLPGYRPDLAVVEIAGRARDGWTIATLPMVYVDGDWRVRVPDDIERLWQPGRPVPSLNDFGMWKGTA
ncbi:hypothetical protein ACWDSJ_26110 [Nocardia sp. NPDC003482]